MCLFLVVSHFTSKSRSLNSAGFVTGGGWINSPVGAYVPDPELAGRANFGFVFKAIDEKLTPSTDVDLFSINIWDIDDGDTVVYDNGLGAATDDDPAQAIDGGQILIHKKK